MHKPLFLDGNIYAEFNMNGLIQASNGVPRTDVGTCTDYLEITQRNKLYWSIAKSYTSDNSYKYVAFYDSCKRYISNLGARTGSGAATRGVIDLSLPAYDKAKYVRASMNNRDAQFVSACVLCLSSENDITSEELSRDLLKNLTSGAYEDNEIYYLTELGELYSNGGIYPSGATKKVSDFIPLINAKKLVVTTGASNKVCFYDRARRYLRTVSASNSGYFEIDVTSNTYSNAAYCRFDGYDGTSQFSNPQFNLRVIKTNPGGISKFNDKSVLIFGDSITDSVEISVNSSLQTTYYRPRKPENSWRKIWPNVLKDRYGFKEVRNYALTGATWYRINTDARKSSWSQVTIALNDVNNPNNVFPYDTFSPDIVIFALGINDGVPNDTYASAMAKTVYYPNSVTIDFDSTLDNLDVTKTNESIRWALLTIKKNFPKAMVFVSLPLQCAKNPNLYGSSLISDIRKMAERCGCIVIESTSNSGIIPEGNFYNYKGTGTTLADGLHPNSVGQQLLARTIIQALITNYSPCEWYASGQ